MSNHDEARYGRACLLVLNICPFILRQVIEGYYTRHGSLSIQDFLEKNKHELFHLMRKKCCCRPQQSGSTPMYRSQWESLYISNSSSCRRGQRGDCPCQYDAKPGITTSVMDITLCCLFITNVCPGITVNMAHIDTIRDIRNNLIHAGSASLDEPTYLLYWSRVENAIIDLAYHVSNALMIDTKNKVKDLETQVMNMAELAEELKRLIVDEKRIKDLEEEMTERLEDSKKETIQKMTEIEEGISKTIQKTTRIEETVGQTIQKMTEIEEGVSKTIQKTTKIEETVGQTTQKMTGMEERVKRTTQLVEEVWRDKSILETAVGKIPDINNLKQRLIEKNDIATHSIPISPLQERGEKEMPIELLYASVVIREDHKYAKKGHYSETDSMSEYKKLTASKAKRKFDNIKIFFKKFSSLGSSSQKDSGRAFEKNREVTDPADIFLIDGKVARNIYMLGDAAHGKTTYCMWLLKNWCNAQQRGGLGRKKLDKWEKSMKKFDFVFLLKFRDVNKSRASIIDMICHDVFPRDTGYHAAIRHVLSSDKYRSLIIMDGLDEWNPNEEASKHLTLKGMPNIEGVASSVSCFISMRPWVFPTILKMVEVNDRVIEIHGLSETGMERVIENVLLIHYKLKKDSSQYIDIHKRIVRYIRNKSLKSFMQIPLLAVVCVQIWYKGEEVGDSMTSFYTAMLNMLIERTQSKHETRHSLVQTINFSLPKLLSAKKNIKNCINVLIKLGKVAYEGLLSKEKKLVYQAEDFEEEIGERELQFVLDVGLISQKEEPSTITKNVSVHFFHKSIQEFLAVIYIVTQIEVSDSFCEHLSNVKIIMELSNVIMFICGMCPSLGSVVSRHVVSVTDRDKDICEYRKSAGYNSTVEELYKLQVSWYRELQYGQTYSPMTRTDSSMTQTDSPVTQTDSHVTQTDSSMTQTDSPVTQTNSALLQTNIPVTQTDSSVTHTDSSVTQTDSPMTQTDSPLKLYVSDVCLFDFSDTETVRVTRELLSDPHVDIRSLRLRYVPIDGERGITYTELGDFLSNTHSTRSLVMLYINGDNTDRSVPTFCVPTLRCLDLYKVTINSHLCVSVCPPLLRDMSQLRVLDLWDVTLGEGGLGLSPDMVHIERIHLERVNLGEGGLGLSPDMVHIERIHLERVTLGEGGLGLSPDMVYIKRIELQYVTLGKGGLGLSPDMVHIEGVKLRFVNMPAAGWGKFVRSLSHIQHRFDVVLDFTNMDDVSVTTIRSSPDFTVTLYHEFKNFGECWLHFTRVWPPSQLTQDDV